MENNLRTKAKEIVDSLPEVVFDDVIDTKKIVREKASKLIVGELDIAGEQGQELLKNIVLYMSYIGYTDSALSFLAVLISNGYFINISTLDDVYNAAVDDMSYALEDNDTEFFDSLTNKIDLLFSNSHKSHFYKNNLEYVLLLGKELERKKDYHKALELYNDLIGKGEPMGYLKAALIYKELGLKDFALSLLEDAYNFYGDNIFLENIVIIYCENGNLIEAKKVYYKLYSSSKSGDNILPFFVYSFIIEDDSDLEKYELMMINYLNENYLTPLPVFKKLSTIVQSYIDLNLQVINLDLEKYKDIETSNLAQDDYLNFKNLYKRKLYLLQIGVTILKDDKYLNEHLEDIKYLGFSNDSLKFEVISEHFDDHFSLLVSGDFDKEDDNNEQDNSKDDDLNTNEKLSMYLANLSMLYYNGLNYISLKKIFSLLGKSYERIGDVDEDEIQTSLKILKNETDYIDTFSFELIFQYRRFLSHIDEIYGKYLRVVIQMIARDTEKYSKEYDYPKVIFENPKVALLFFIEKLVSQNFPDIEYGQFGEFLEKYDLESNNSEDLLLFAMLLYDNSFDNLIDLVINNEELSNNTFAIYYLLESLINGEQKLVRSSLKDLNLHYKEKYGTRGFISFVKGFLSKREKEEISDEERGYIKLCYANLGIIQNKGVDYIMNNILEAEKKSSLEATMQLGNMLEDNGYFEESIIRFVSAFNADPNINTISKLISVLLNKGDYDNALKYITLGIKLKYEMSYYLYSYHLNRGDYKNAIISFIDVINREIPFIDVPIGTNQKLVDVCMRILSIDSEVNLNLLELKLLSSFVLHKMNLTFGVGNNYNILAKYYLDLFNILGSVPLEDLPDFVQNTVYKFCSYDTRLNNLSIDLPIENLEQALDIIDFYAKSIEEYLLLLSKNVDNIKDYEELKIFINDFTFMVYSFFSQINGAEEYSYKWRTKLYFDPIPNKMNVDEKDFGSKLIN
ncbi:MAG: hypothetical protein PHI37_01910 [Candidatus Gracilibacteria bacterium]|nr:hypothetical protein [Candidatus Gracilibacteria bacterium]